MFFICDLSIFASQLNYYYMEVVTVDSEVFKEIMRKLDVIYTDANMRQRLMCAQQTGGIWLDSQEVSDMLNVSVRTLQRLRKEGLLAFSYVRRRCRYKVADICRLLDDKTIRCDYEHIQRFKQKYYVPCNQAEIGQE